jgi:hypothetical protein
VRFVACDERFVAKVYLCRSQSVQVGRTGKTINSHRKEGVMRKAFALTVAVAVFAVGGATMSHASDKDDSIVDMKFDMAEVNLLIGLESDNMGLSESSAYMLGELKSGKAVIPLMNILRSGEHKSSRVVAALALCRIGDARGVYAVKQAAKFDDSEFVQQKCAWFYDQYVQPGSFDFIASGAEQSDDSTSLAVR